MPLSIGVNIFDRFWPQKNGLFGILSPPFIASARNSSTSELQLLSKLHPPVTSRLLNVMTLKVVRKSQLQYMDNRLRYIW